MTFKSKNLNSSCFSPKCAADKSDYIILYLGINYANPTIARKAILLFEEKFAVTLDLVAAE